MTNSRLTVFQNFRKVLSFSQPGDVSREQLKSVNQPTFFEDEKEKVKKIKSLLECGKQEVALSQLLDDFANEDGIRYFNRIRYFDDQNQTGGSAPESRPKSVEVSLQIILDSNSQNWQNKEDCLILPFTIRNSHDRVNSKAKRKL